MGKNYCASDRMANVIGDEPHLLQIMSRFGIPAGVGDKTIAEICEQNGVSTDTFLAVANFMRNGAESVLDNIDQVSVSSLMNYLRKAHDYFLSYQLPALRRRLIDAIGFRTDNKVSILIMRFYDEFTTEVHRHMEMENNKVFKYVDSLIAGNSTGKFNISLFARHHSQIEQKIQELKNIIMRYYHPDGDPNRLNSALFQVFVCEADLSNHCQLENELFIPVVAKLEEQLKAGEAKDGGDQQAATAAGNANELSEREQEVVRCIVRGMTNKEMAAHLFISVNTVLTHRKNITRKLNIHSASGLTIYAILNHLINLDEIKSLK